MWRGVESTITWNNALTSTQICTFAGPADGFVGWHKIANAALTSMVQDWVSGSWWNNGLAIIPLSSVVSDDEIYADSRENISGRAAKLVIYYNP